MFKVLLVLAAMALPMTTLVGCGKTEAQKAEEKVQETKTELQRMDDIAAKLKPSDIFLQVPAWKFSSKEIVDAARPTLASKSDQDLQEIKRLLNEYIAAGNSALTSGNADNVLLTGQSELKSWIENAKAVLAEVEHQLK